MENCLEAIRRARTERGAAGTKLDLNQVWVHVWPVVEADLDQLTALQTKITPLTDGAGIEEVQAHGRVPGPDGTPQRIVVRFRAAARRGRRRPPSRHPRPSGSSPSTTTPARSCGPAAAASSTRTSWQTLLTGPGAAWSSTTSTTPAPSSPSTGPGGRTRRPSSSPSSARPTPLHPEGVTRVVLCGDPTKALGAVSEPECARIIAAIDLAERHAGARRVVRAVGRRADLDGLRHGEHGLGGRRAAAASCASPRTAARSTWSSPASTSAPSRTGTPRRPCSCTPRGILVMTPDSAMVLTGKQSLDFSGGVSAEDNYGIGGYDRVMGPNGQAQYWAPDLAAALGVLMEHYQHTYVVPGEPGPRRAETTDPVDRDVSVVPSRLAGQRLPHGRRDLLRRAQPGPQEGVRHPHGDARRRRPGPGHPGTLGRHGRRGHRRRDGRPPRRLARVPARDRVPPGAPARVPAHRRPGHLHRGHAVPALLEEGGAGDQRRQREPSAGRPGQPVRLRRLAGLDAAPAAGVRRGDRPGHRQLPGADRVLRDLPLPRRGVRGVLQGAQPVHDRARRRGLLRLRHRRRAGGSGGVRRGGGQAVRGRPAPPGPGGADRGGHRTGAGAPGARPRGPAGRRCGPRRSARWRRPSTACTTSTGRWRSVRSTP